MKIFINFDDEKLKADVQVEKDHTDHVGLEDAMPYIMDALYDLVVKYHKDNMMR